MVIRAPPRARRSAAVSAWCISVAASRQQVVEARAREEREAGTPPSTPLLARAATNLGRGLRQRTVNSLKKLSLSTSRPAPRRAVGQPHRVGVVERASCVSPLSPSSVMWMVKASAHRPEFVQMLEVAFSRRMCCSRVDSVSTKPRLPSASTSRRTGGPASGARSFRASRTGRHRARRSRADCRSTGPSAATMSAPISPGGSIRPSDTISVNTATSSAPLAWQPRRSRAGRAPCRTRRASARRRRRSRRRPGDQVLAPSRRRRQRRRASPPKLRQRAHVSRVVGVQAAGQHDLRRLR
jgi:hypothetical protein